VLGIEVPLTRTGEYWTERRGRAMGSDVHIVIGDAPAGVLDWAIDELERSSNAGAGSVPTVSSRG
jgi:hypothetical protein